MSSNENPFKPVAPESKDKATTATPATPKRKSRPYHWPTDSGVYGVGTFGQVEENPRRHKSKFVDVSNGVVVMIESDSEFIGSATVQNISGVPWGSIVAGVADGSFPSPVDARQWVWRRADVERWIESKSVRLPAINS